MTLVGVDLRQQTNPFFAASILDLIEYDFLLKKGDNIDRGESVR